MPLFQWAQMREKGAQSALLHEYSDANDGKRLDEENRKRQTGRMKWAGPFVFYTQPYPVYFIENKFRERVIVSQVAMPSRHRIFLSRHQRPPLYSYDVSNFYVLKRALCCSRSRGAQFQSPNAPTGDGDRVYIYGE